MIPVLAASQFDPGAGRVELILPVGLTVAQIVRQALPGATAEDLKRIRVALVSPAGSSIIAPALWHAVRPKPGARVVIRLVPGKGALRAVLSVVVAIAAVALAYYFAPALAGALGWGASTAAIGAAMGVIGMGVNLIGNLLINALVPPVKPDTEKVRNTYSISGWRNRLDPDGAVPFVLGGLRYAPPFAARPYTEIVGDWQYVRCIFLFGEGRLNLSDFRIGDTPLSEFDEVQTEIRKGLADDLPCGLYPQQIVEETVGVDLVRPLPRDDRGEVIEGQPARETPITRTTGSDAKSASIILAFPAGLIQFTDDGNRHTVTVRIRVEQCRAGSGDWQAVTTLNISAKRQEAFYRQRTWALPARGRWDIRLTMLTDETEDSKVQQRTAWAALQTIRPEYPIAYDRPLTLVSVRVKATHQLSGALDNFTALASWICPDWNHETGTWVTRATSNPASLYRLVLQHPSNPKAVPNGGIDLQQLQDWHDFCRLKGLAYNRVLDQSGTSLRDVLTEIAAAGRATPRHDGLKWGVVIDRPSELIVDHVSPRNSWNFSCRRVYAERPHGFIVRFQDETDDFKENQRVIPWPGHEGSIDLTEMLDLPGITNPDIIFREATRRMYEAMLRPDVYEVTDPDAGPDAGTAQVQLYRSMSATLDRETDKSGKPVAVSPSQSHSITVGDTTRQNLIKNNAWVETAGSGWSVSGGIATHAPGESGDLSQPISMQAGRWYRIGYTVSGRTAGGVTPRLTGGTEVSGPSVAGNGPRSTRLQAVPGNNAFTLAAGASFDGSLEAISVFLETPACLAQGTHYLWLEPQTSDGLPGPVAGPSSLR
ncbi:phage tail protein [Paracoccus sp. (in: a-proteobacteria)]|uniref:TipJ family phage tail tip protein n=1 Tax=Paracoccus sp. TaxID=267 RepID=UPI002AFEE2BC|nr:phage tail protein [Paracoccus sp. (in: a-proteobacteria)]